MQEEFIFVSSTGKWKLSIPTLTMLPMKSTLTSEKLDLMHTKSAVFGKRNLAFRHIYKIQHSW